MLLSIGDLSIYSLIVNTLYRYPFLFTIMTFLIGWSFMPLVIRIARERGFVVRPNKRTVHNGDIPNIGGLDIFISYLLLFILFAFNNVQNAHYVVTGLIIIMLVGFMDDLIVFKPKTKLVGELLAGVMLIVFADVRISNLYGLFGIEFIPLWASYILSFIVLVGIINALNLIDGVDGLASGLGMLYSLCFAIYFYAVGDNLMSVLAFALIGALAVFFIYNVFGGRHKIFMGDCGSLFLGYMMTWFVFEMFDLNMSENVKPIWHISAVPAVCFTIMFVPLFDTMRVMMTRLKQGKSPFSADRNHIHHLLLRCGFKHKRVTAILLVVSLLFILLAWFGANWRNEWLFLAAFFLGTTLTLSLWKYVDFKVAKCGDPFLKKEEQDTKELLKDNKN